MDGETIRVALMASGTAGALGVYGFIIKSIWRRQNKDHDTLLKLDTMVDTRLSNIEKRLEDIVNAFNDLNGKKII